MFDQQKDQTFQGCGASLFMAISKATRGLKARADGFDGFAGYSSGFIQRPQPHLDSLIYSILLRIVIKKALAPCVLLAQNISSSAMNLQSWYHHQNRVLREEVLRMPCPIHPYMPASLAHISSNLLRG